MPAILRPHTVWRFLSVDGKQAKVTARPSTPYDVPHHFQEVLWSGDAYNSKGAIAEWEGETRSTRAEWEWSINNLKG